MSEVRYFTNDPLVHGVEETNYYKFTILITRLTVLLARLRIVHLNYIL